MTKNKQQKILNWIYDSINQNIEQSKIEIQAVGISKNGYIIIEIENGEQAQIKIDKL